MEALEERGIPFVIRNLTILNHPLVRDLLAYLRLLAQPSDNVACARVLAAPAWGFEPSDLVRLCERAAKRQDFVVGHAAVGAGRAALSAASRAGPASWWRESRSCASARVG